MPTSPCCGVRVWCWAELARQLLCHCPRAWASCGVSAFFCKPAARPTPQMPLTSRPCLYLMLDSDSALPPAGVSRQGLPGVSVSTSIVAAEGWQDKGAV